MTPLDSPAAQFAADAQPARRIRPLLLWAYAFVGATLLIYWLMPIRLPWAPGLTGPYFGIDWKGAFIEGILKTIAGQNPYDHNVFNPFWTFLLLAPIALLPPNFGAAVMAAATLFGFAFAAHRLGARPRLIALLLLSPPVLGVALNGNVDWLVALGLVMPPWLGLFFVLVKPQLGAAVALYWVVRAWQDGGWQRVVGVAWPVSLALALSVALYGPWFLRGATVIDAAQNSSVWPYGLPVGALLLYHAIRAHQQRLAVVASPFFTPYIAFISWGVPLLGLVEREPDFLIALAATWFAWAVDGRLTWLGLRFLGI